MPIVIWLDNNLNLKHPINTYIQYCFLYSGEKELFFLSVLDYVDVTHGKAAVSTLKSLYAVYHSGLSFITNDPYSSHHHAF